VAGALREGADAAVVAVALTALIDGLWLELSLGQAPFSAEEAEVLAAQWLDALTAQSGDKDLACRAHR
jgi:hypothetical protein